jgi:hypothetical protein
MHVLQPKKMKGKKKPNMVEHTSNPSTQEAEVGESRAPVQPGVHNETVLKKKKKKEKKNQQNNPKTK